jgi:hypothetical protein
MMYLLEPLEKLGSVVRSVTWSVSWALAISGLKVQWPIVRTK